MGRARDAILDALENLTAEELKKFKLKLLSVPLREGYGRIPRGALLSMDALDLTDKLVSFYLETYGAELTANVLRDMGLQEMAGQLQAATHQAALPERRLPALGLPTNGTPASRREGKGRGSLGPYPSRLWSRASWDPGPSSVGSQARPALYRPAPGCAYREGHKR
ncbi:apoptosis-associated speck-like protein containing a CARD isoform X3 [Pan paniscus]|uniref:apoptosis-associated speck-like protein containing a CARD isoform X3 n=1 Tax=Pan paniscus TaxID=9597 RepID=UPI001560659D|nr:apoptosis-associated speck-like protein containing a CARD isoform X3 [Pan paniscus]